MNPMNPMEGLPPGMTPEILGRMYDYQTLVNKVTTTGHTVCFKNCVHQFVSDHPNMNPAEQTCMDRCTNKFYQAYSVIRERREALKKEDEKQ